MNSDDRDFRYACETFVARVMRLAVGCLPSVLARLLFVPNSLTNVLLEQRMAISA